MPPTASKGTATAELEKKISTLQDKNDTQAAQIDEYEEKICELEASKKRLIEKRGDEVSDDAVMAFIAKKAKEYDPDKAERGAPRRGPKAVREISHLFSRLRDAVKQYDEADE